jgi:hypothetical protein
MQVKWHKWIYVSQDQETDTNAIKERLGADAKDIWKLMDGWYPDYIGWDDERLDREFRILRKMLRMGMPEHEYQKLRLKSLPTAPEQG